MSVKAIVPPKKIMKAVGQAVIEWGMIQEGDRLLLGLSLGCSCYIYSFLLFL
jgi:hypothetical protein